MIHRVGPPSVRVWLVLIGAMLAVGCKPSGTSTPSKSVRVKVEAEKSAPRLPVLGTRVVSGEPSEMRASPDGKVLTVLIDGQVPHVTGAPPTMKLGDLWAVPVRGGEAVRVAHGVTNLPGGWLYTSDSRWLVFSANFDPTKQLGELFAQDLNALSAERVRIAASTSYFVISDDGKQLAFVEGGVLHVGPLPSGPYRQLAGEVSTADFAPDGKYIYFRRKLALGNGPISGGGLFQVALGVDKAEPKRIVDLAGDYTVLGNGKQVLVNARAHPQDLEFQLFAADVATRNVTKLTDDAARFRATRNGRFVAWRSLSRNNVQDDVGELWLAELPSGTPRKLGARVKDFEFSPDSTRLVYRENFERLLLGGRDAKPGEQRTENVGDLYVVDLPDAAPKLLQKRCPNFLFSNDGQTLAYTARVEMPEVTRRLLMLPKGGEARIVKEWIYEYQFRPPGKELFFRADCTRDGRSCMLSSLPVDAAKDAQPKKEVEGTFGARFSADGAKVALAYAHLTDGTFDLSIKDLSTGVVKNIDQYVEWPVQVLGEHGDAIAYLVKEKKRPGLYVATAEAIAAAPTSPAPSP